jgi:hypothetical protein
MFVTLTALVLFVATTAVIYQFSKLGPPSNVTLRESVGGMVLNVTYTFISVWTCLDPVLSTLTVVCGGYRFYGLIASTLILQFVLFYCLAIFCLRQEAKRLKWLYISIEWFSAS